MLTRCIFGNFFSSSFMYLIQAFWLVAEAAAETIAMSPVLLICLASRSTSLVPIWAVEDTMRAFAPLLIAAWMAGICEAGVAWVPLVSVPVAPSVFSAAIAPPDLALSAVVK